MIPSDEETEAAHLAKVKAELIAKVWPSYVYRRGTAETLAAMESELNSLLHARRAKDCDGWVKLPARLLVAQHSGIVIVSWAS